MRSSSNVSSPSSLGTNKLHPHTTSIIRDQPNSREKNARFHGRIFKMCQISRKIHGKSFANLWEIYGSHRRYFEVLRYCKRRNFRTTNIQSINQSIKFISDRNVHRTTLSQDSRQSMSTT